MKIVLLVCLFFLFFAKSRSISYSGYQLWKFIPTSEGQIADLIKLEKENEKIEFWKDPSLVGISVDVQVPPGSENIAMWAKERGMEYTVIMEDIQTVIDSQKPSMKIARRARNLEEFDYTMYHTADEIYEWIDLIVTKYEYVTKRQVAVTFEGRPVYAVEIRKPSENPKPVIYVDTLIHCREWITTATMIKIFNDVLVEDSWMVNEIDWLFIPMLNVDGYIETHTGDRLWRKTKSTGASTRCVGTDGNRNWDDHWGGPGSSPDPCSIIFRGPTPMSESEVRQIANYILGNKINGVWSVHSYGQLILYPYNYAFELAPDVDKMNTTAKRMHDAILNVHGRNYKYGPGSSTIYVHSGTTSDWTYSVANITLSYINELREDERHGFLLPEEHIIPSSEEIIAGLRAFAQDVKNDFVN